MTVRRGEILFEMVRIGAYLKVTAVDPVTNTEAAVIGPPAAGIAALQAAAVRKLDYVNRRRKAEAER